MTGRRARLGFGLEGPHCRDLHVLLGERTPLAIAVGAGAESRRPIGAAVVGGLVFSTVFTLLMIPTVHYVIVRIAEKLGIDTIPPLVELQPIVVAEAPAGPKSEPAEAF